jgi:hypothetical protein
MMMLRRALSMLFLAGTLSAFTHSQAQSQTQDQAKDKPMRAFVELFTSQGCSSCPPADQLFSELALQPDLIVISLPVDYWDYLGWKDTLAKAAYTNRQRAYAQLRGDRKVYTPQAVVNGIAHTIGSSRQEIEAKAQATYGQKGAMSPALNLRMEAGKLKVTVIGPAQAHSATAQVLAIPTVSQVEVTIGRGENSGRKIVYANVARDILPLGIWDGTNASFDLPLDQFKAMGADGYVVIVQSGSREQPGAVLSAMQARLKP